MQRKIKHKFVALILAASLAVSSLAAFPMDVFAGTGKNGVIKAPKAKKVTGIFIFGYPANNIIDVGKNLTLTADFFPPGAYADYKKVTWESSNSKVATVDKSSGKVTANEAGQATITAKAKNGSETQADWVTKDVTITVRGVTISGGPSNNTMDVDDEFTLTATLSPENVSDQYKTVEWESSNTDVATVNASTGEVKAIAPGQATITATAKNGSDTDTDWVTKDVTITVRGVTLNKSVLALNSDDVASGVHEETLQATVLPEGADQTVTWSSDKTDVATVASDGTVTAKKLGEATITATAGDGFLATCKVYVDMVVIKSDEAPKENAYDASNFSPFEKNGIQVTFDAKGGYFCNDCYGDNGWYFYENNATTTVTSTNSNITIQKCKFYTKSGSAEVTKAPFTVYNYSYVTYTGPDESGDCLGEWGVTQIDVYFTRTDTPVGSAP